mgnify:CR=1 FL=1
MPTVDNHIILDNHHTRTKLVDHDDDVNPSNKGGDGDDDNFDD